ncbi:MAG TPA: S41 family peptidase [Isosphaeraceae bacterium]|nr:S41 family peptidase [Isosphaeraceae bacterium]
MDPATKPTTAPAATPATNTPAPNPATAAPAPTREPEAALQRALEFERQRNWMAAITAYEDALDLWPDRTEFRHRLRLCEIHYKLARRYQDHSFRTSLLSLPEEKALELFDEVLERIQTHYVDAVGLDPLLRHGLDNLEVALRDPTFLRVNVNQAPAERVKWLRDQYRRQRDGVLAHDRAGARAQVLVACQRGQQGLGLRATPVILEFVYGTCDALDDYSSYLTPDRLDDLYAMIDGNFVGLGVELKLDNEGLRLVNVIRGGPASEAGLKMGDRITHVGDAAVRGLGLDEAAGRLQGAADTSIAITILHSNGTSQRYVLTRRPVEVESVAQARIVEPTLGIGYVQLTGFQKSSAEELDRAIASLQSKGMRYLVLDVRGNPGGLLNVAVEIADRFLDSGVIVSTRGRAAGQSYVYRARADASWRMPMAILIDHDSASASEILAGALKDHNRALVVGQRSYGKGSVQSIYSLRSAPAGLKLTTAKFYSPQNRPYSEQGVEPDVLVRLAARPTSADDPEPLAEFGDPGHDTVLTKAIEAARRQLTSFR